MKAFLKINIDRPVLDMGKGDVFSIRQLLIGLYFAIAFCGLFVNTDNAPLIVAICYYGFIFANLINIVRLFNKYDKNDRPSED